MIKNVVAVLFALAFAHSAWAQQMLTAPQFRDAALALVQAQAADVTVERVGELGAVVRRPVAGAEPLEMRVNFDAGYREYTGDPSQLDAILGRWSRLILAPVQERGRNQIISVLRHRDMASAGGQQLSLVWRPFAGDLIEILAFDSAEQIRFATPGDIEATGLTLDAAWALAPDNMLMRLGSLHTESYSPTIDVLSGSNGITPSLLTAPEFCAADTMGKLYLVADRNLVVVGEGREQAHRQEFVALARAQNQAGNSISATPLECRDGRLQEMLGD